MARRLLISMHMRITPKFCRVVQRYRRPFAMCLALLPLATGAAAATIGASAATDFQELAPLEAMARLEAARQFPALTPRQRLVAGPIESHVQLAKCSHPVAPVVATPHHMQDRVMIELRCPDPRSWHLYVQVRIVGTSPVAVTAHAIIAGTVLKASDLKVEEHDISDLPLGFLDDPAIAVGLTASRPIAGGSYLTNQQLVAPKAVLRGQSVTLMADTGGMSVRMAGRALGDGLINQRVKVQNLSSGKIVEGIARSEQTVEIISQ
jgi:flagella basal body P-ring formation protein FlgA